MYHWEGEIRDLPCEICKFFDVLFLNTINYDLWSMHRASQDWDLIIPAYEENL